VEIPETRYAQSSDGVYIAYQVVGDGPLDVVYVPTGWGHLDLRWEWSGYERVYRRFASFSRLILFDRRGTGLSDRHAGFPAFDEQIDDVLAVMDAAGCEHAAMFGDRDGAHMAAMIAATHPERVRALALYETQTGVETDAAQQVWFNDTAVLAMAPSLTGDESFMRWWRRYKRSAMSPGDVRALGIANRKARVGAAATMAAVRVPALVVARTDTIVPLASSREVADLLGAKFVTLPGRDAAIWAGDVDAVLDEIEEFLTGVRPVIEPDRALATVLFTDIVSSTEHAARLGDRNWTHVLNDHDALVGRELDRHRGRKVNPTGDGMLATFDGPARAVKCAQAICAAVQTLGIDVRAGLHTGEVELRGDDIGGIAVHIGQRVSALAGPGEVLVSRTVTDLVAGSGLEFADRGEHELKGVPGRWAIYSVVS
jgi:class 3 adenylate cyclase